MGGLFDHRRLVDAADDLPPHVVKQALRELAARHDLVLLDRSEFARLVEARETLDDIDAVDRFRARLAAGEEEFVPAALVDRVLAGESPVRVWREHRGLSATELAQRAEVSASYLSEIERGVKPGSIAAMKALAAALGVAVDDLV